jgi:hypothetical protein
MLFPSLPFRKNSENVPNKKTNAGKRPAWQNFYLSAAILSKTGGNVKTR